MAEITKLKVALADQTTRRLNAEDEPKGPLAHLLTRTEAAAALRYSLRTLDILISSEQLAVVKFAGKTYVRPEAIEDFIARHSHAANGK